MLADLYVVAFKVDLDLPDQVWELWSARVITDEAAEWAWGILGLIGDLDTRRHAWAIEGDMSWQRDFDAAGPKWEGHAAAVAEEKRLQKMMEEIKLRAAEQSNMTIDESVYDNLDQEMRKLYEYEHELMRSKKIASSEAEKSAIEAHLLSVRSHFHELRIEYKKLKQVSID